MQVVVVSVPWMFRIPACVVPAANSHGVCRMLCIATLSQPGRATAYGKRVGLIFAISSPGMHSMFLAARLLFLPWQCRPCPCGLLHRHPWRLPTSEGCYATGVAAVGRACTQSA
jgi:hypothetical protein